VKPAARVTEELAVRYRSFELDPNATPAQTEPTVEVLADKYGLSPAGAEQAQRQMQERARQDGLTFRMDGLLSGNTRDAHRLVQLASDHGRQTELVEGLHRAYFTDQRSVFEHGSLTELAVEAGPQRDAVLSVLSSDAYADRARDDAATARALGATGVPFFVFDGRYGIAGAQSVDTIAQVLHQAWREAHPAA
jgi:predicted DsbA family dithiol-disulfide isomerase